MRSLIRVLPVALLLAAGCGQKGPLVLKSAPSKAAVPAGGSPPATTAAPDSPGSTAAPAPPAVDEQKDPADDKSTAPRP